MRTTADGQQPLDRNLVDQSPGQGTQLAAHYQLLDLPRRDPEPLHSLGDGAQ